MIFKLVLSSIVLCAALTSASAATFMVTSPTDSGPGSLRQAIIDANASPSADTINFSIGLYGPGSTIFLGGTPLTITGSPTNTLSIVGPSGITNRIEISGNNASPVFVIQSGVVSISGLIVLQGRASGAFASGGGIYSAGTSLTLDRVDVLQNSSSADGGGIYIDAGTLTMTNSSVFGNTAARSGGGIAMDVDTSATITNSFIDRNSLLLPNPVNDAGGGGISLAGAGPGAAAARLALTNATLRDNRTNAGASGGGIFAGTRSIVTLDRSALVSNSAAGDGGGLIARNASLNITNTTIAENSARSGGGIYRDSDANSNAGNIVYSTIARNTATTSGGGIATGTVNPINVRGSIVADNTAASGPDILGSVLSQGYNLFESLAGAAVTGTTTGNITGVDPVLGPLTGNGFLSIDVGSPALDAGSPANFPATDQRGTPRPADGDGNGSWLPDIGAFERGLGTVQFNSTASSVLENVADGLARIAVVRVDGQDGNVTVQYSVSNGSATLGSDYQIASGTLTFAGDNAGTITIPIVNDSISEPNETIIVSLVAVTSGAKLGSPTTSVLTIVDDDLSLRISGRVITPMGQGLRNAVVEIVDAQGTTRTATTSSFGTYSFDNIQAAETYTMRVFSKRYRFAARTGTFGASAADVDFVGLD